jgi:hypothetical protein
MSPWLNILDFATREIFRMFRATRKRFSGKLSERRLTNRYVVTRSYAGDQMHVMTLLNQYPTVVLVDELDETTALVEMTPRDRMRISRQHPELMIEPNIGYRKLG